MSPSKSPSQDTNSRQDSNSLQDANALQESGLGPPRRVSPGPVRVIEFFAGIGGLHAAWPEAEVVAAFDVNENAQRVYELNFATRYFVKTIESLNANDILPLEAGMWWLSPPCQPFTRRGKRGDLSDRRTLGLVRLIELIRVCRPAYIALENVIGFESSDALRSLTEALKDAGYHVAARTLCPSEMGWPNRRPRFYFLASQHAIEAWRPLPQYSVCLRTQLESEIDADSDALWLSDSDASRHLSALDRIDPDRSNPGGPQLEAACFASSYGKAITRSGSYLQSNNRYRRFTPRETARLLGFPDQFRLGDLSNRQLWKLLGNSLSLPAVRYILSHLECGPSESRIRTDLETNPQPSAAGSGINQN